MAKKSYRGKYTPASYSGRRRKLPRFSPRLWIALAVLLAVLLALFFTALYLRRFMVYSSEGGRLVLPGRETTTEIDDSDWDDNVKVVEEEKAPD